MPSEDLPDLDPTILLSAAGQREFEAAAQAARENLPVSLVRPMHFSAEELASAEQQLPDIASIFWEEAAREIASEQDRQILFGVDFAEGEEEMVVQAFPNERARFQVGRESPPEFPVYPIRREGQFAPSDGEVVSRRAGGRFQPVPRVNEVRRQVPPGRPVASRATQIVRTPEPPQKVAPTALERLLGPDPFK